jgi:hypothetical protein
MHVDGKQVLSPSLRAVAPIIQRRSCGRPAAVTGLYLSVFAVLCTIADCPRVHTPNRSHVPGAGRSACGGAACVHWLVRRAPYFSSTQAQRPPLPTISDQMSDADSWKALEAPLACGVLRTPLIGVQQRRQRRQRVSLTAPMMASLVIVRSSLTQRMTLPMGHA